MARKKSKKAAVAIAIANGKGGHDLEQLAAEGKLTEADYAILSEIAANRKAILRLGVVVLDHERRLQSLETAVGELAGEEPEAVDIEAEREDEAED